MSAPAASTQPRRRQHERRSATRRALLEAALGCIQERGYAATTTPEIGRRAGVSQGALFKHFPTKADLLAAAAEHLFAHLIEVFRAGLPEPDREPDFAAAVVRQLWSIFQEPRLHVAFELYVAARTDAGLRESLVPVVARHGANLRRLARALFPEVAAARPDFDARVALAVSAVQGAALGSFRADDADVAPLLAHLTDLVRETLAPVH